MMIPALSFLLLLQSAPDASKNLADALAAVNSISDIDCADPATKCPSSKRNDYRLPLPVQKPVRSAADALKNDGSACAVIGQTICETKPRPVLRIGETPEETLRSSTEPE